MITCWSIENPNDQLVSSVFIWTARASLSIRGSNLFPFLIGDVLLLVFNNDLVIVLHLRTCRRCYVSRKQLLPTGNTGAGQPPLSAVQYSDPTGCARHRRRPAYRSSGEGREGGEETIQKGTTEVSSQVLSANSVPVPPTRSNVAG